MANYYIYLRHFILIVKVYFLKLRIGFLSKLGVMPIAGELP